MKAAEVISSLQQRGVKFWQEAGALRYEAPVGALTDREKATLKAHKDALIKALEPDPTTAPYRLNIGGWAQLIWLAPDLGPAEVLRQTRARYPALEVTDDAPAHGWPRLAELPELPESKP